MADKQISQLVAATTINNDDLFVMQQGGTAKKLSGQKLSDFVYQSAADQIERVDEAVEQAQAAVDSLEEQKNEIAQTIASMAGLGTDTTLTTPGMAADAAATGEVKDIALARFEQAEITGVPIATFEDGADNVPVKKLIIGINPVQDLHGYDNPWPAGGGKNLLTSLPTPAQTAWFCEPNGILFKANTTYTFSVVSGTVNGSVSIYGTDKTTQLAYANSYFVTYTPTEDTYGLPRLYDGQGVSQTAIDSAMLEIGSSRTDFAPYSNICPITGWTGANIYRCSRNRLDLTNPTTTINGLTKTVDRVAGTVTLTNTRSSNGNAVLNDGFLLEAGAYKLVCPESTSDFYFRASVNGSRIAYVPESPSFTLSEPTVVSAEIFCRGGVNANGLVLRPMIISASAPSTPFEPYSATTYTVSFPVEAGTVYGGTLDVPKGKLAVTYALFDMGESNWSYSSQYHYFYKDLSNAKSGTKNALCSVYPIGTGQDKTFMFSNTRLRVYDSNYTDTNVFKGMLDDEDATLVYELATPVEYDLTPTEVRTLLAFNSIWSNTGNILDLIYRKEPMTELEIQEQIDIIRSAIAVKEDSGVASTNYSTGALILVGSALVEVISPIAQGESIIIGTNCEETTVAAQISYLKAIVENISNVAYLTYENA